MPPWQMHYVIVYPRGEPVREHSARPLYGPRAPGMAPGALPFGYLFVTCT
jgi:hypothetical protein